MSQSRAGANINYFSNNINSNNTVYIIVSAEEKAEILAWLSPPPLELWIRHENIRAQRVEHVGDWLLQTEEYRSWFNSFRGEESYDSALFCYGDPGVGKTYITSLVIDTLADWAMGQDGRDAKVACFYFDFAAQKEQTPIAVLRSLLRQLVDGLDSERIPAKIVEDFQRHKKAMGGRRLGISRIVEILQDLSSSRRTFICIDAIDECMAEYRAKLLESLEKILLKSPSTRIFLAGRVHIRDEVENRLPRMVAAVSTTPTRDDIIRFLRAKLREDVIPGAMDESLVEEIMETIPATISEIFLLVSLNIKAVLQEKTLHRRREKLRAMADGSGLGGAYGATIGRIKAQEGDGGRLGMEALMWISHSQRPLKVDEICHALAVEIGAADININNVPSIRTVLDSCQGLAAVDAGSSIIRLIHFTLKEHLFRHADLFERPQEKIAEVCLTYLNSQTIKDLSASSAPDSRSTPPFLEYCSLYWGTHMRMELSDRSRSLALNFLDQYDNHISARLLAKSADERRFKDKEPFSALHCISYFGIAEVAIDLIRTKRWGLNERDSSGLTPLMWAARYGREEVVKVLLEKKETQPDMRDPQSGQTALSYAARGGYEGVVRLFLGPLFINPGSIGGWRGTPRVMRLFFGRNYINPDKPDYYRRTPLSLAAKQGHDGVVEQLLRRKEVKPDTRDRNGRTLLSLAAGNGCDGVVKLLLGRREVIPDKPDDGGRTPLSWAAHNGHDEVVKVLLERGDVNPDKPDKNGRTPLWWSACNGTVGVVKLLLEREDVDPSAPDNDCRTPLFLAAWHGHNTIVKLLLEREDVDPNKRDRDGQTLLLWATRNGRVEVVELLLGREDVTLDTPDSDGRTLLSWAARNGYDGVVKLLLEREDVSPDRPEEDDCRTPLFLAAWRGHNTIVKLLLEREDVDPNKRDRDGQTLLLWATRNGRVEVVELLLGREDVTLDIPDSGRTVLSWAARNGHDGVVKLLLEREDVSPDRPEEDDCRTPLSLAAWRGYDLIVKLLLERDDVSPDRQDMDGQTALSWAAQYGCDRVVELLLERDDVNPNKPDNNGQTPLSWAAKNGCDRVVKLLLEREGISPDRPDNEGRTPLSWAAWNESYRIVELLLARSEVNPNRLDNYGQTALSRAAENGCHSVIELLEARTASTSPPWCVLT